MTLWLSWLSLKDERSEAFRDRREQMTLNHWVVGSSPTGVTSRNRNSLIIRLLRFSFPKIAPSLHHRISEANRKRFHSDVFGRRTKVSSRRCELLRNLLQFLQYPPLPFCWHRENGKTFSNPKINFIDELMISIYSKLYFTHL